MRKRLFWGLPQLRTNNSAQARTIWLHAASVGEVQVAEKLIRELEQTGRKRFFLTTMTRTGNALASERLAGRATCLLAPLDVPWLVHKAISYIRPDLFVCIETELWPALLTTIRKQDIPMALVNGRMSRRSYGRYIKIGKTMHSLLSGFSAIAAISERDAERFAALSGRNTRITISGNSKYGGGYQGPERLAAVRDHYRKKLGLGKRPVFLCGSTRSGEEQLLFPAYRQLRKACNGNLVWLIAPRHLERVDGLMDYFTRQGVQARLFSHCRDAATAPELIIIDCMGKLAELYAAGDFNFCGGSLVNKGGHNIMEVVSWGLPVYFGPHMDDFADAARLVTGHGAGFQVADPEELGALLVRHQAKKELYEKACQAAIQVAQQQNMAVKQQAELLLALLKEQGRHSQASKHQFVQ